MAMTCGLCKRQIRGDEDYIIDHYKCSADLTQSLHAERDELLGVLKAHDAYMAGHFHDGPGSDALHPTAADNWKRVRAAIAKAERASA